MVRALFFLTVFFTVVAACQQPEFSDGQSERVLVGSFNSESRNNAIGLVNLSDGPAKFKVRVGNSFPVDSSMVVESINQIAMANAEPIYVSAWRYVCDNTFHQTPPTTDEWLHKPSFVLNSVGGGYCDDRAHLLCGAWTLFGYRSRVVYLGGHVVSEVYTGEKWSMFDPDHEIYYLDSVGNVADIACLLSNDLEGVQVVGSDRFHETIWNPQKFDLPNVRRVLLTEEDNVAVDYIPSAWDWSDMVFEIPDGARCVFGGDTKGFFYCWVEVDPGKKGRIDVPLIPYGIDGAGTVRINDSLTVIGSSAHGLSKGQVASIEIVNLVDTMRVYYYVNPLLLAGGKNVEFTVLSNDGNCRLDSFRLKTFVNRHRWSSYLADVKTASMNNFSFQAIDGQNQIESLEDVRRLYQMFLKLNSLSNGVSELEYMHGFDMLANRMLQELGVTEKELTVYARDHYPRSLYLLYYTASSSSFGYLRGLMMPEDNDSLQYIK